MSRPPGDVLCLAGPTGAGKTALALDLAAELDGEIINFDSRQVYADFPVITAQPTPGEQARCPHRLYGFLPCEDKITAGVFTDLAEKAIAETVAGGRLPIFVGGTGLYLRALLQGLAPIPEVPAAVQQQVLADMDRLGPERMHEGLAEADPQAAGRIHPNDRQRIARALEVWQATNRPLSWWQRQPGHAPPRRSFKVFLDMDMEALAPRLEQRIGLMLDAGALDEVARAWARCPDRNAPGWSGIGCAELLAHYLGECSLDEACELWFRNTRAYAKRQHTWFRKEPDMVRATSSTPGLATQLADNARRFFNRQDLSHEEPR